MQRFRTLLVSILLSAGITTAAVAAEPATADSPQALYLQAGKLERLGESAKAKAVYETIIDRFPASEFAVKANDRLLELVKPVRGAEPTPSTALPFLTAPTPPPLPTDPVKRRVAELARLYAKAEHLRDEEYDRNFHAFENRYGRRYNRSELADRQKEWDRLADERVVKELGMTLVEIRGKLDAACRDAGITGTCDEKAFSDK